MVTGNLSAAVTMHVSGTLAGGGGGHLNIDQLSVKVSDTFGIHTPLDGLSYTLFPEWESISIDNIELPNIGLANWDTSQLSKGILSINKMEMADCDFDASGNCGIDDIDRLMSAIAAGDADPQLDMNEDGKLNLQDRDRWLVVAGTSIGISPLLTGDADLNGGVDAADLMQIGLRWQQHISRRYWSQADFNADGIINAHDLNDLGRNWQAFATRLPLAGENVANPIPEPMSYLLVLLGSAAVLAAARRLPHSTVVAILAVTISLPRS